MREFSAGAGMREIMPSSSMVNNTLHACMTVRLDETGSPLRAKALALRGEEATVLVLSIDIIHLNNDQSRVVRDAVSSACGVPGDRVAICATHTHSSPMPEPLSGPHPYLDFVAACAAEAARDAVTSLRPAKAAHGTALAVGASFNTRVPVAGRGVKFTRDFREGLASGRPVDPRLSVLRIDDEQGRPIAGYVRFAAHPACVIFDAPISAEYPGYMTDALSRMAADGAPVLFGYGASGDVNCVPMFGCEADSRRLGMQLAKLAGDEFVSLRTTRPGRMLWHTSHADLPLDEPPSIETLDREIAEIEGFIRGLESDPTLEWVIGINCKKDWAIEKKKGHVAGLLEWAKRMKAALQSGRRFPPTWCVPVVSLVLDDLGLVLYGGEVLVGIGLELAARSPLAETLLMTLCNGGDAYIGRAEDRREGGYETCTATRYSRLADGFRPLPYAPQAAEKLIDACLACLRDADV